MSRQRSRSVSISLLFGGGALLIWLGFRGLRIDGQPAQYFGFLALATGVAAECGINIWVGGPLSTHLDPPESEDAPEFPVAEFSHLVQQGEDTLADLEVLQEWAELGRTVSVELSPGKSLQIAIPPGIETGMFLRMAGESLHGPGALLLRIRVVN